MKVCVYIICHCAPRLESTVRVRSLSVSFNTLPPEPPERRPPRAHAPSVCSVILAGPSCYCPALDCQCFPLSSVYVPNSMGPITVSFPPPWAHLSQLPRQAYGESAWKQLNQKAIVPHCREVTWEVKMTFKSLGSALVLQ